MSDKEIYQAVMNQNSSRSLLMIPIPTFAEGNAENIKIKAKNVDRPCEDMAVADSLPRHRESLYSKNCENMIGTLQISVPGICQSFMFSLDASLFFITGNSTFRFANTTTYDREGTAHTCAKFTIGATLVPFNTS